MYFYKKVKVESLIFSENQSVFFEVRIDIVIQCLIFYVYLMQLSLLSIPEEGKSRKVIWMHEIYKVFHFLVPIMNALGFETYKISYHMIYLNISHGMHEGVEGSLQKREYKRAKNI